MISATSSGSFGKTAAFLQKISHMNVISKLSKYGADGVSALSNATPLESGLAAQSWSFEVGRNAKGYFVSWFNSDVESGFPVAIMIQYGYGTGTGGYVPGRDYINPTIKPIFDRFADQLWKEVTSA